MANSIAYLVLYLSPLVVIALFRMLPRTPALIWAVVGGYLFLPIGIGMNLPLLPALTKDLLPVLAAAVMCLVVAADRPGEVVGPLRAPRQASLPVAARAPGVAVAPPAVAPLAVAPLAAEGRAAFTRQRTPVLRNAAVAGAGTAAQPATTKPAERTLVGNILLGLLVGAPFLTVLQNAEPVIAGPTFIAGLRPYDAFSLLLGALVTVLPLLLARRYLATAAHHTMLLRILCAAGLIYSLPALFEVRMSPQLNVWFYGYFPHSFAQQVRDGGYRPVVFIGHGLIVALFFAVAVLAAFALWRARGASGPHMGQRTGPLMAGAWLLGVLVLCKSLGALISTLLLLPLVLFTPMRVQMILAATIAMIVLSYPMLRGADLIPVDRVTAFAASISEERAQSFEYRLRNEDALLDRANRKPFAGWGSWGRNRIYDPDTGADISVTDGAWIIIIGVYGWLGYVAQFGLLTIPTLLLTLRQRAFDLSFATTGLCLVLAVNLIDLIPNSGLTPLTWLIAGAILGYWERGGQAAERLPVPQTLRPVSGPVAASRRNAGPVVVRDRSGAVVRQSGGG